MRHVFCSRSKARPLHALFLITLLGLALPGPASAFSGALSSAAGEILGTGNWIVTGPTALSWAVTPNGDGTWHYDYTFSHPGGETSHFVLEVSATFEEDDIFNAGGDFEEIELGDFGPDNGNPNMPGDIHGLKFDDMTGISSRIWFDCTRGPVWGEFYSKNGRAGGLGENTAWNAGFLAADPSDLPSDGSLASHILVPDTYEAPRPPVPEPTSLLLLGAGLLGVAVSARRRIRR